ncbi:IgA Peptidase M64 [Flavobacterium sp. ACN2]|uniref:M64 family metallopeptidase n=1 Tax=Flavobacterium sp. TaxID=239 RepID=UPI000BB2D753|nr:IgA Peptidase M64 [Flavobacterium sp. ACN2]
MPTPIPAGITLETIIYNGPTKDKKNLLFLGDGFSAADRALFDRTINEIVIRFFRKAPFNLRGVKEHFNIFKAFTPSPSSGISCAVPVDANGITVPDNPGTAGAAIGTMIQKSNALGLTYGYLINGTPMARLIGPKTGDQTLIMDFIATLTLPSEAAADNLIPQCWAAPPSGVSSSTGKDHALVIVLVNDDKYGGGGHPDFAMVCLGDQPGFQGLSTSAAGIDHNPGTPRNNYNNLAAVSMHELGHSHFRLIDEYSEINTPAIATTAGHFDGTDVRPNAVTRRDVLDTVTNAFDPSKAKWYKDAYPGSSEKLIGTDAFTYMQTNLKPLWERPAGTVCANIGFDGSTKYPPVSIRNGIRYPQRIIGLYEGGAREGCGVYIPAGSCRMKSTSYDNDFCYVCKYAIIEKIDPTLLEALYRTFYPRP